MVDWRSTSSSIDRSDNRTMLLLNLAVSLLGTAQTPPGAPSSASRNTACDTCTDPAVQKTGWWHGVGLNCPSGGDEGLCDICTAKNGNSPEVVSACTTAQTEEDCCQLCTMWNAGRLPGGLKPGNTKTCSVWYFRKEGTGGWCGLKDCAGPGACGPAASGENMVSGPACGTKAIGWTVVSILLCAAFVYVGGGVMYAWKVTGSPFVPQSHPQYAMWHNIGGLVMDGVAFSFSRGQRRRSASSQSGNKRRDGSGASEALVVARDPQKDAKKKRKKGRKGGAGEAGSGDSDDASGIAATGSIPSATTDHHAPQTARQQSGDEVGPRATASGGGGRWVHVPT